MIEIASPPKSADEASRLPATPRPELDAAVAALATKKAAWLEVTAAERVRLLEELISSFRSVAERWVEACLEAEGIPPANPLSGEEWLAGPYMVFKNLQQLRSSLADVAAGRRPRIPGGVTVRDGGQVVARVFPGSAYDRLFYPGMTAEVWMEPEVSLEALPATQAVAYFEPQGEGRVALVLGAGNVSSIGPMDALYKLFVEDRVVLFKAHPVNDYLGPLLEEGFAPLVRRGFFEVVYGGAAEGAYLAEHAGIDEIHVTGSDKTVDAIVFGPGEEGRRRKAERRPRSTKIITSELGNVSPVIVVPGPWGRADFAYHGENLVTMLANNAGFNCNATRLVLTHAGWGGRGELLDALRQSLAKLPSRRAFYPGAASRWQAFVDAHPQAERYGEDTFGRLPWAFIPGLDPGASGDLCFTTEAFASVFAEASLEAADTPEFLRRAVAFANERVWGTLNACLIVHPTSLADPAVAAAVEQAIADLRYGTVAVNHWPAIGYGLVVTPWGGFPGSDLYDVQSGCGWVHNTLMFDRPQKAVVRAPFRARPKPPWFVSHRTAHRLARVLTDFEAAPSLLKLPAIFGHALAG